MKTIPIFRSIFFDLSWPPDIPDSDEIILGGDLAVYLQSKLANQGVSVSEPYSGEGVWFLDVTIEKVRFSLLVQWLPVGSPAEDWWVVSPAKRRSFFGFLFNQKQNPEELLPICTILHKVLDGDDKITEIRWLDLQELLQIYR